MSIKIFTDRPILACVISVAILLLGLIALVQLPIEQFPEIAPPTVSVSATYTGASAETVQRDVVVPLEEAINGVEDMMYMVSTAANNGSATIQIFFRQGIDADMAMVNVQNRIATAQGLLPAEVTRSGVTVRKRQTSRIKILALYSPDKRFDQNFISNYMKINIEPRLSRITGVGEADIMGNDYSLRIWLDPNKMAEHNLVPADIKKVLDGQNIESPTGTLGAETDNTFRYVLKYRGRYEKEDEYGNLVVCVDKDGTILRLKDVARIELGARSYDYLATVNGAPGVMCMISQTSGSNANEIITNIDKLVEEISDNLPAGLEIADLMSTKDFLDASIANIIKTLLEAILLVVVVVYFFLQSFRATLIPALSIVVSLIGTFAFLQLAGFSLNLITLFALVLVIGTVVDDSIVVVEAVQAEFDKGCTSAYEATNRAVGGISTTLLTTTFVFMAVFIPVSFMGGTTGVFYKQFGLTMAVAVCISLVNALTLSPALCALMMTPHDEGSSSFSSRFHKAFETAFGSLLCRYKSGITRLMRRPMLAAAFVVLAIATLFWLMQTGKTGFVPKEDMGTINIDVQTAPGTNLAQTRQVMKAIEDRIKDIPQIDIYSATTGRGMMSGQGTTSGMFQIRLKNWDERTEAHDRQEAIIAEMYRRTADITTAKVLIFTRGMIPGYGQSSGFELYIQDQKGGRTEELGQITNQFLKRLNERPEISRAMTSFDMRYPQYLVDVDAVKCKRAGVEPEDVLAALSGYVGGYYASNMNRFTKLYRVMLQASPEFRLDTHSLNNIFVRNASGEMSPIMQYITLTKVFGPQSISRFNLFPAISVNGEAAEGYSSGEAIKAVREVAREVLPAGYGFEFGGMSREEASQGASAIIIFAICVVFMYLILCALYESVLIPVVILLSVPFGLMGSFLFARMFGLENNIYLQIGLLMLIGLLAKTAILLTEYATERRAAGMSIFEAAVSAAEARLRPILMTSLTMIFGMLPMMFSSGVGANGNTSIGVGTVGGMLIGTLALLFIVPVLFLVMRGVDERLFKRRVHRPVVTLLIATMMLSSCAAYKKYEQPEMPPQITASWDAADDTLSIAHYPWREFFSDPQLQTIISEGMEQNKELAIAYQKTEEARAALTTARLAWLPSLSLSADGKVSKSGNSSATRTYSLGAMADWEVDVFGKLTAGKRMAVESLLASEAYSQAVQSRLVATIAESYFNLLALDEGLSIYRATLASWQEMVRTLQALMRAGRTNEAAVLQAQANVLVVEQLIEKTERDVAVGENALSVLIGRAPGHIERTSFACQKLDSLPLQTGIPIQMLRRRPDVREAEHRMAAAFYATGVARSQFYPSLTLSGTLGFTNSGGGLVVNPGGWLLNAAGSLLQPIFNKGRTKANLQTAKAQQEEARLSWQQTVLDAGRGVCDALAAYHAASQCRVSASGQVELLEKAERVTSLLMQHSAVGYLEVLTAQQSLLAARQSLLQYRLEQIAAIVTLYHALGGGIG